MLAHDPEQRPAMSDVVVRLRSLLQHAGAGPDLGSFAAEVVQPLVAGRETAALRRDERIVIYGDYDVDGITATAVLHHVIKALAPGARLLVLSADGETPASVARLLTEQGFGPSRITVLCHMNGPRESLITATAWSSSRMRSPPGARS